MLDIGCGPSVRRINRLYDHLADELPEDSPRIVWYTPEGRDAERERQLEARDALQLLSPSNRRRERKLQVDDDARRAKRDAIGKIAYQRYTDIRNERRRVKAECLKPMILAMLAEAESLDHVDGVRMWCAHNKVSKEGRLLCDERAAQIHAIET